MNNSLNKKKLIANWEKNIKILSLFGKIYIK